MSMREHVWRVAQICFFNLRRLRSVRRQLSRDVTAKLVCALVLTRLDYCNAVPDDRGATAVSFQRGSKNCT